MLTQSLEVTNKEYYGKLLVFSVRACLHGVGDPSLVGLVSFVFTPSGGHKTKETYATKPGSPTPCKQGLRDAKVALGYRLVKEGYNTLTIVHGVIFCCITHQWRPFVA